MLGWVRETQCDQTPAFSTSYLALASCDYTHNMISLISVAFLSRERAVVCLYEVLVAQSYLTLCDPMDCSLPGSSVHGILQTRILEWVDIPFSKGSSQPTDWTQVSCIAGKFFTIWATRETPVYMCVYFKRQFLSNWKFWWTSVVCSIKNSLYWLNPPYCFSR